MIRYFLLLNIFLITLFGNVTLKSKDYFIENSPFSFELEAVGEDITFPKIDSIDGNIVQNLGTSRTITNINGNVKSMIKKSFKIFPKDGFILPSFSVEIDGKVFKTKEKKISKKDIQKSVSKDFDLSISVDKSSLFVGESTVLTLTFAQSKRIEVVDLALNMPSYKNIWIKRLENAQKTYETKNEIIHEIKYLIYPQKSGKIRLSPAKVEVKTLASSAYSFSVFSPTKTHDIYSNHIDLEVQSLPSNVSLIGEFILSSEVSSLKVKATEPVSYKLKIEGYGNIEDFKGFDLKIDGVTVYENPAKIDKKLNNNNEEFTYEKTYSILSNKDFTIPSLSLEFFDKNIKKIVTQKTKEHKILVEGANNIQTPKLEKAIKEKEIKTVEKVVYKTSNTQRILFFILGSLSTILIFGLFYFVKSKKPKEDLPLVKKIKATKSKNILLKLLIPYLGIDERVDKIVFELEKNKTNDFKELKKDIIKLIDELKL